MKTNINTVEFFCRIDEETLEEKFESLRRTLLEKQYIPMVRNEHGQIIYVVKKPPTRKPRSVWINIILLIATIFTTTLAGALQWVGYRPGGLDEHVRSVVSLAGSDLLLSSPPIDPGCS